MSLLPYITKYAFKKLSAKDYTQNVAAEPINSKFICWYFVNNCICCSQGCTFTSNSLHIVHLFLGIITDTYGVTCMEPVTQYNLPSCAQQYWSVQHLPTSRNWSPHVPCTGSRCQCHCHTPESWTVQLPTDQSWYWPLAHPSVTATQCCNEIY